jgi:hypothetical protein
MYPLLEPLLVGLAVFGAATVALRKWWPSKKRAAGCGSGCSSCSSTEDGGCGTSTATGVPTKAQTVAMPQSRRPAR